MPEYTRFKKPIHCPNAIFTGFHTRLAKVGDLIVFDEYYPVKECKTAVYPDPQDHNVRLSLGRILGTVKKSGTGLDLRGKWFVVMTTNEIISHACIRYVPREAVVEIRPNGERYSAKAFMRWFLFSDQVLRPEDVKMLSDHGSLSEGYINDYVDSQGNFDLKVWKRKWRSPVKENQS